MTHLKLPSPALVIACLALLVSLSGTAIAASPSSSSAGLLSSKTQADSLAANAEREFVIACDAGKKIVSAGYSSDGAVFSFDSRPMSDTSWGIYLANVSESRAAAVSLYAVCLG